MGPGADPVDLSLHGVAAVDRLDLDAPAPAQLRHLRRDLQGELPGGGEDDGLDRGESRIHLLDDRENIRRAAYNHGVRACIGGRRDLHQGLGLGLLIVAPVLAGSAMTPHVDGQPLALALDSLAPR